jgi:hypothetical protein
MYWQVAIYANSLSIMEGVTIQVGGILQLSASADFVLEAGKLCLTLAFIDLLYCSILPGAVINATATISNSSYDVSLAGTPTTSTAIGGSFGGNDEDCAASVL